MEQPTPWQISYITGRGSSSPGHQERGDHLADIDFRLRKTMTNMCNTHA